MEPSGLNYEYKAWSVGKHRQAAKVRCMMITLFWLFTMSVLFQAEIEKLKLDELDMKDLVREAARIIMAIRDENKVHIH